MQISKLSVLLIMIFSFISCGNSSKASKELRERYKEYDISGSKTNLKIAYKLEKDFRIVCRMEDNETSLYFEEYDAEDGWTKVKGDLKRIGLEYLNDCFKIHTEVIQIKEWQKYTIKQVLTWVGIIILIIAAAIIGAIINEY